MNDDVVSGEGLREITNTSSPLARTDSERLLVLEVELRNVRIDMARANGRGHNMVNEMQKFVALEQQCATNLTNVLAQLTKLDAIVTGLVQAHAKGEGVWFTLVRVGNVFIGAALIFGALSGKIRFTF